jgi:hypothetical protein
MTSRIKYVDGFYADPDVVRAIALRSDFYQPSGLYGFRSRRGFLADGTIERIKAAFGFQEITLRNVQQRSTHFYHSLARGPERVRFCAHYDAPYDAARPSFALLIYLAPGAPKTGGTGVYRHTRTGLWQEPTRADARRRGSTRMALRAQLASDGHLRARWQLLDRVDNIYNRAVAFPAHWYHSSCREFGTRAEDGKLYHAFFFQGWPDVFAHDGPSSPGRSPV